jgi:Flp pilus assembly protein TadB
VDDKRTRMTDDEIDRRKNELIAQLRDIEKSAADRASLGMQQGAFAGFAMALVIASLLNALDHSVKPWWGWPVIALQAVHLVRWARRVKRDPRIAREKMTMRERIRALHSNEVAFLGLLVTVISIVITVLLSGLALVVASD